MYEMFLKIRDAVNKKAKTKGRIMNLASLRGRNVLGMPHPRDASSQGGIIQGHKVQGSNVRVSPFY
jgi:hypothetical protein